MWELTSRRTDFLLLACSRAENWWTESEETLRNITCCSIYSESVRAYFIENVEEFEVLERAGKKQILSKWKWIQSAVRKIFVYLCVFMFLYKVILISYVQTDRQCR